jgi:hypothetical protein
VTDWDPRETIAAKRDRRPLPPGDVERFVLAYATEEIGDGPAAAFLMAALLNGLDDGETLAMTRAMIASGETVTFGDLGRPTVDKHSTGGVADGVTLVFAPLAAARAGGGEAVRTRARSHGWDARQARSRSRGSNRPGARSHRRARYGRWVVRSRPSHRASCRPTEPLRAPRRDGNGSVRADRRKRDVEETRRRLGPGSCLM